MPWRESTCMSQRQDFIALVFEPSSVFRELCDRFDISRKTGYKWLARYRAEGLDGLADRSRQPRHSPQRVVDAPLTAAILSLRAATGWGGRKIKVVLEREGWQGVPAASTISSLLKRHGCMDRSRRPTGTFRRFEMASPNDLWQMDFKGPIRVRDGRCVPLTITDDHSRYALGLRACRAETHENARDHLTDIFRHHGLPWRMLMDNGHPWGATTGEGRAYTEFEAWLMQLGVIVVHSRPRHPQTCGKEERFHRTLKQELTGKQMNCRFDQCQPRFDVWRHRYNTVRPHEALDMETPASRYRISEQPFPEILPDPEYDVLDAVRKVKDGGRISYKNHIFRVGRAFLGKQVAIRPTERNGIYHVFFYKQKIATLDFNQNGD